MVKPTVEDLRRQFLREILEDQEIRPETNMTEEEQRWWWRALNAFGKLLTTAWQKRRDQ